MRGCARRDARRRPYLPRLFHRLGLVSTSLLQVLTQVSVSVVLVVSELDTGVGTEWQPGTYQAYACLIFGLGSRAFESFQNAKVVTELKNRPFVIYVFCGRIGLLCDLIAGKPDFFTLIIDEKHRNTEPNRVSTACLQSFQMRSLLPGSLPL